MKKFIVIFAAIAMVGAFAFTAAAADWAFYGSSRMETFSKDVSKEITGTTFDDTDTTWDLQGNARLGANVNAGDVYGRFEMAMNDEGLGLRILWGEWNFGGGKLGVGQTYTPLTVLYSNQVVGADADLLGYGAIYHGRRPMIQLTFGSFKIALVEPIVTGATLGSPAGTLVGVETDTTLPMIMANYKFKSDTFFVEAFGGYASHDQVAAADKEYSIDSYLIGVGFNVNLGAAYIKANIYLAQNNAALGAVEAEAPNAIYNATNDSFEDTDTLGYIAVVGFKVSDTLTIEAGYGATKHETDFNTVELEDNAQSYYVNATIILAPGVFVVPEIGKLDLDDISLAGMSTPQGDTTYFGLKWQINF